MVIYIVVGQLQIFGRINIRYFWYDNMIGVYVEMFVIGNVNFFIFSSKDGYQCGEFFFGSVGKILVCEWVIGVLFEQISGNQVVGVDEVGFQISVFCDFFIIECWWCEDIKIFQFVFLEQFGYCMFQCNVKVRMGVKRSKVGIVSWVEQYDVDNWIFIVQ